jgi:hypothetical protein
MKLHLGNAISHGEMEKLALDRQVASHSNLLRDC